MGYASTLPLPKGVRLRVEATLLAAANSVLLVIAGLALMQVLSPPSDLYAPCCLLVVVGLAAIAQHAVLTRRHFALAGVVLGDGALAVSASGARWLLLIAAVGVAAIFVLSAGHFARAGGNKRNGFGSPTIGAGAHAAVPSASSHCIGEHDPMCGLDGRPL